MNLPIYETLLWGKFIHIHKLYTNSTPNCYAWLGCCCWVWHWHRFTLASSSYRCKKLQWYFFSHKSDLLSYVRMWGKVVLALVRIFFSTQRQFDVVVWVNENWLAEEEVCAKLEYTFFSGIISYIFNVFPKISLLLTHFHTLKERAMNLGKKTFPSLLCIQLLCIFGILSITEIIAWKCYYPTDYIDT